MKFSNGKNISIADSYGNLPQMANTLAGWTIPMVFVLLVKTIVNAQVVEDPTNINFQGVWQPFTAEQLKIKPEGERSWPWYMCHSTTALPLATDDIITYKSVNYRVMESGNYNQYGFYEYHLVQDFSGTPFVAKLTTENGDELSQENGGDINV